MPGLFFRGNTIVDLREPVDHPKFGKGKKESINATVMLGRDCDSTATAVGFLVGALHRLNNLPKDWADAVQQSNLKELDLLEMGERLYHLAGEQSNI